MQFISCYSLTGELTLPENLESIGRGAFEDVEDLQGNWWCRIRLQISQPVSFPDWTGVTAITIGTGVTYIYAASDERHALYMPGVKTVTFLE